MTATAQPTETDPTGARGRATSASGSSAPGSPASGMAIRLKQSGIDDFVVWERDGDVGGTWWANTYPGCQCDIPSHLYSFSFALNPDWGRTYATQPEIEAYIQRVTERVRRPPARRDRLRGHERDLGRGERPLERADRARARTRPTSSSPRPAR